MSGRTVLPALSAAALALCGCGGGERVKEQDIEVKTDTALNRARKLLENYSKGQAVGSEATSFDALVADVRKEDPPKADALAAGLADLQKAGPGKTAAKAKEVLAKIAPNSGYPKP